MNENIVYVKYEEKYQEWGEEYGGTVLGVFSKVGMEKNVLLHRSDAHKFIYKKLKEAKEALKRNTEDKDEIKRVLCKLSKKSEAKFRSVIEVQYMNAKKREKFWAQKIKEYKKTLRSPVQTCLLYLNYEYHVTFMEMEIQ